MSVLQKLEESYEEMQFHKNYFPTINQLLTPSLHFDQTGQVDVQVPLQLTQENKNLLDSYSLAN
jgi:hypothetical protein